MTFKKLYSEHLWRAIPNCPGRYVLELGSVTSRPQELAEVETRPIEFKVAAARDPVLVLRFVDGGLISYRHTDGKYLHTLNNESGFRRKIEQLGIDESNLTSRCG